MSTKPEQPTTVDLPNPGLAPWVKLALLAVGGLTAAGAGTYGYVYYRAASEPAAPRAQKLFADKALPPGFFPDNAAPEPLIPNRPKEWVPMKPGDTYPAALTAPAVEVKPMPSIDFAAVREQQLREAINEQRRGAGQLMTVTVDKETFSRVEWTNTDKDFGAATNKTIATFPVNLSRVLTADRFIPAVLIQEINSELEGKVVAQIEQHVYASHGRKILVPAGSKAIGRYLPFKKAGETRLRIVWERILTPDGINIRTVNAEMADAMGRAGITGDVDNRNFDKYGMALLVSLISAIGQLHVPADSAAQKAAIDSFGRELSRVTADILQQSLDIKPRVTIPAGSRILISPVDDIWFKEPIKNVVTVEFVHEDKKGAKR